MHLHQVPVRRGEAERRQAGLCEQKDAWTGSVGTSREGAASDPERCRSGSVKNPQREGDEMLSRLMGEGESVGGDDVEV